jgi:anthranilate phosphoribosyltransferase
LGVGRVDLLDPVAGALAKLGVRAAYVVCGQDGLDEVSLSAPTLYRFVFERRITSGHWTPASFKLEPVLIADIKASSPRDSARMILDVLEGKQGPARRVVLANAAVALMTAGKAPDPVAGVRMAEEAIDSGQAADVLHKLQTCPAN